ncbi:MAG: hypothetical protein U0W40_00885 [Acidimicrobiia bacterium]
MSNVGPPLRRRERPALRAALPTEHGGAGASPSGTRVLFGILRTPGIAGVLLACAAVVALLVRTPLKVALVDAHRHRDLNVTALARRAVAVEGATLVAPRFRGAHRRRRSGGRRSRCSPACGALARHASRGRRLAPEIAGGAGIGAVAAMIVLAGGETSALAAACWMVLAARVLTAIPSVRAQVMALHGRTVSPVAGRIGDVAAIVLAALAVVVEPLVLAGAIAVVAVVLLQHLSNRYPAPRAALGVRQSVDVLVIVTALGVLAALNRSTAGRPVNAACAARVFEAFGLDYCCGGFRTLDDVPGIRRGPRGRLSSLSLLLFSPGGGARRWTTNRPAPNGPRCPPPRCRPCAAGAPRAHVRGTAALRAPW